MGALHELIKESLTNHSPDESQVEAIEAVRHIAKGLGYQIEQYCPPSRERSLAVTHLEESVMWAVKSIVLPRNREAFDLQVTDSGMMERTSPGRVEMNKAIASGELL